MMRRWGLEGTNHGTSNKHGLPIPPYFTELLFLRPDDEGNQSLAIDQRITKVHEILHFDVLNLHIT